MLAIDPDATYNYIVPEQRKDPRDKQVTWHLRPLSIRDEAELSALEGHAAGIRALEMGLRGWDGFKNSQGLEATFERNEKGEPTHKTLARISVKVRIQLANAILRSLYLEESEVEKPE